MTRLGILGGGQLAQMLTQVAISFGIETAIFERSPDSPASRLTPYQIAGAWEDEAALATFASWCDVITLENEFVDASVLDRLENMGVPVYPTAHTLAAVQDKLTQKETMQAAGLPLPSFCGVDSPSAVLEIARESGWPLVLKARRDGYDGYGNATLYSADDLRTAWERLAKGERQLYVEGFVPFMSELAVMVVRGRNGEVRTYPVVETVQQNHICHVVRAPAAVPADVAEHAATIARHAVEAVNGVGIFGIELFLLENGEILYNEIAPRPHNSGHYTIEGCVTSQFENHIRAVMGWPLGSTKMVAPAAVMINLLGKQNAPAETSAIIPALVVPGAHVHMYGKRESRAGRKMGHVTVTGEAREVAEALAREAADQIML